MPKILGFRADAKHVYWAVVEGDQDTPVVVAKDKASAPVDLDEASSLAWYRVRVHLIISTQTPTAVAIRQPEPIARGSSDGFRKRLRIEGVRMEASREQGLQVTPAALVTISSKLGTKSAKKYIEGDFRGIDLSALPDLLAEAVLVAVALLPKGTE